MSDTDALVERILTTYDTITVVGASRAGASADRVMIRAASPPSRRPVRAA